jgi:hypothetical protein
LFVCTPRSPCVVQRTFHLEAHFLRTLIARHQRTFAKLVKKDVGDLNVRCGSGCQFAFGKAYCYPSEVHHHSSIVETRDHKYYLLLSALRIEENIVATSAVHGILLFAKELVPVLATPVCPLFKLPHLADAPCIAKSHRLLKPDEVDGVWTAILSKPLEDGRATCFLVKASK